MEETRPLMRRGIREQQSNMTYEMYNNNKKSKNNNLTPPNWRQKNAYKLYTSKLVIVWDLLDFVLNLALVCIYIIDTQFVERDGVRQSIPIFDRQIEFGLASVLLFQYFCQLLFAGKVVKFFCSLLSLVSVASTIAPMLSFSLVYFFRYTQNYTYMNAGSFVYLYPLRFLRLQLVAGEILSKSKTFYISETTRKGLSLGKDTDLGTTIFLTLLTISSLVHIVSFKQTNTNDLRFIDAFFFTAVSSTSGYKTDLVPENSFTRMVILYVMIMGAVFLPKNISEFLILMNKKSKYVKSYKSDSQTHHIVVCGNFSVNTIAEFLREFFCDDHGSQTINTNVVILNPNEPEEEIVDLLNRPLYAQRVQYVKGNAYIHRYLEKAKVKQANACFILSNIGDRHMVEKKDAETVMTALAIRKHTKNVKIYAVVSLPESKQHLSFIVDYIVCIEELRLGLLAQSTINKGFSSFIFLLTTSFNEDLCLQEPKGINNQWFRDYTKGATNEIYPTKISSYFVGLSFVDFAEIVFRYYGAIAFSMRRDSNGEKTIYLNPAKYILSGVEIVFIICDSLKTAQKISKFDRKHFKYNDTFSSQMTKKTLAEIDTDEGSTTKTQIEHAKSSETRRLPEPSQVTENLDPNNTLNEESKASDVGFTEMQKETIMNVVSRLLNEEGNSSSHLIPENLENHIIICDPSSEFPNNLEYLIGCFRKRHLKHMPDIVILTTGIPSQSTKNYLKRLNKIYFVNGSPLLKKDLYRAGVTKARKAVVLCESRKCSSEDHKNPGIIDAPTLLITMNIESMCLNKNMFIVAEFFGRNNMKLLNQVKIPSITKQNDSLIIFTPSFMSGNSFCSLSLETIICQSYYNPFLLSTMEKMIFGNRNVLQNYAMQQNHDSYENHQNKDIQESNIFKFHVPKTFVGDNFYKLFIWSIRSKKSIIMSIYRTEKKLNEPFSYVILNPSPELILEETDKVFVLANVPW